MRMVAALMLGATLAALTGCGAPADAPPEPTPTPTATPVFASEEEALAAAEKAYTEYLKVSDEIARDGGRDPHRLAKFVTDEELDRATAEFEAFAETERKTAGESKFDTLSLQQVDLATEDPRVVVYLCLDVSDVRVLDASGKDVTPDRDERLPLSVTFVPPEPATKTLLLEKSEQWSSNFCE